MQIILLESVDHLGGVGSLVKVKTGYARNFLIPRGKAIIGTKDNIKLLELKRTKLEVEKINQLSIAKQRADKIINFGLIDIKVKSGEEGKLFGSIGPRDVVACIGSLGESVQKSEIKFPHGLIKNLGIYEIFFQPHPEYVIPIKINIIS